jgi:hypothetical protein
LAVFEDALQVSGISLRLYRYICIKRQREARYLDVGQECLAGRFQCPSRHYLEITTGAGNLYMNKSSLTLISFTCILSSCAIVGLKEETQSHGAKFTGNHAALARCVIDSLRSDSRWMIRELQFEVRRYPVLAATEIYAYPLSRFPGIYARNSPRNPDAVISYPAPVTIINGRHVNTGPFRSQAAAEVAPGYSFLLTLKRTDEETVVATLSGKKYEGEIAWGKLKACSAP